MNANYRFILDQCARLSPGKGKILDYGCGKGLLVEQGKQNGLDMYGVEAFSYGSGVRIKEYLQTTGLMDHRVKALKGSRIPFPDEFFDLVISNQVFEHVTDLDICLVEIARVLKPHGRMLALFASKEVIREGHCGIGFAHRFPKSMFRYYWLFFFKLLGFGRPKRQRSTSQWAAFFNNWLEDAVTYRRLDEIHMMFDAHGFSISHMEEDYMAFRLKDKGFGRIAMLSEKPHVKSMMRLFCQKWGGLVFVARKKN